MLDDPNNPLGAETWRRGVLLGAALVGLFAAGAVIIFVILYGLGMAAGNALIVGSLLGPIAGAGAFIVYWIVKRPTISTIPTVDKSENHDHES